MTSKEQLHAEFADTFLYHESGVFRNGQIEHPEFKPLTFENVNTFLDQAHDRIREETLRGAKTAVEKRKNAIPHTHMGGCADCSQNSHIDQALEAIQSLITKKEELVPRVGHCTGCACYLDYKDDWQCNGGALSPGCKCHPEIPKETLTTKKEEK